LLYFAVFAFYHAVHFSAKRDIVIACRLSVTLVDCDHIGCNSSKIISQLVSMGRSLSADPNIGDLLQGEHPEILAKSDPPPVDLSVGDIRSQIVAEWLQIAQRSQWRAYRKPPPLSNGAVADPLRPPLPPKMGVPYAPRYANGHISATGEPIHFMFGSRVGFSGSADRMSLFVVTSYPSWRQAVIFTIAQLSCFELYLICVFLKFVRCTVFFKNPT